MSTPTPKIVVVGAGYAGALAAARLISAPNPPNVTLISDGDQLIERVRLHERAARPMRATTPLSELLGPRVTLVNARALRVEPRLRRLHTDAGALDYDALILATGSRSTPPPATADAPVFGLDYASICRLCDALPAMDLAGQTICVIGGGLSAVETVCEIAGVHRRACVCLISPRAPLAELGPQVSAAAAARLRDLGVRLIEDSAAHIDHGGVWLRGGEYVSAGGAVWAAGMRASVAIEGLRPSDDAGALGRVEVDASLRYSSEDGGAPILIAGDAAYLRDAQGAPLPMGCKLAMPMGAHAADNALRAVAGLALAPFSWADPGGTVALGPHAALGLDGEGRLIAQGRLVCYAKRILSAAVVTAIRWQARGWLDYRWRRGQALLQHEARGMA